MASDPEAASSTGDVPLREDVTTDVTDPIEMRAKARIGRLLKEKWRLDVLLGVGGMAAVYAATHRNGSRVAIKILHAKYSTHDQVRARFVREGYAANAVGHEGVVKILDDDVAEDGSLFLVTELLDGETLEERRVRCGGRLEEGEVLWAADQVLDVLAHAHVNGVIHRDVKPENIFLTRAGQIKVLDFGIARLRAATTSPTETQSGEPMGTPAFMPPEQARGLWDEVDARSDLWALGATMFTLLTGTLVHDGRTSNELLLHAMTEEPAPLESLLESSSPAIRRVVDRALSFDVSRRWQDARRMQEAVREAYQARVGKPITTSPRLKVPRSVPDRTLRTEPLAHLLPTAAWVLLVAMAALGVVVMVSICTAPWAARRTAPQATAGSATGSAGAPRSATSGAAGPSPAPEAEPQPFASASGGATSPRASKTVPRAGGPSASPAAVAPEGCNPPYTVDAAGRTHFKVECL